jgi:hypothetical protein
MLVATSAGVKHCTEIVGYSRLTASEIKEIKD